MGIEFRFPRNPDWGWLKDTYPDGVLLHVDFPFSTVVQRVKGQMGYLATPYSREVLNDDLQWDAGLSLQVETKTARWVRKFALEGVTVVSPVIMACSICHADPEGDVDPLDDAFWSRWCQPILAGCGAVIIPAMPGWDRSRGVWREACWALLHNVPVYLIAPGSDEVTWSVGPHGEDWR